MVINWKSKLKTKTFWVVLTGLVLTTLTAFGVDPAIIAQVGAIMGALAALVIYLLWDGKSKRKPSKPPSPKDKEIKS
jgi:hypothetical protein